MTETLEEFKKEQVKEPQPPVEGKPPVEEKPDRPEKNYEAELKRKNEELDRIREENETLKSQPPSTYQQPQADWRNQIETMAANEMAQSGSSMPWNTLAMMTQKMTERGINQTITVRENAEKVKRSFLRKARKDPAFKDVEDDFLDKVDLLKSDQVNEMTLQILHNSVKGQDIDRLVKEAEDRGKKEALKDSKIVGPVETGTSTKGTGTPQLTTAQQAELDEQNSEDNPIQTTPVEYLVMLKDKQARWKAEGKVQIPQTLF